MQLIKKSFLLHILSICVLSLFTNTLAAQQIRKPSLLEFSLALQNQNTNIKFSTNSYKTKTSQLGIQWYEPLTPNFHGGLEFGYLEITQIDNPLPSAQYTSGEYAGLLLRYIPLDMGNLSVQLNLNYRYSQTRGSSSNQETEFSWYETVFSTALNYQLTSHVGLYLGADYIDLDGTQRDSGNVSKIAEFTENKPESARFGVNFTLDRTGVIGIEQMTGFRSGISLYFLRKF